MKKTYSVFVDDMYYYDFVALYNSYKYYENKIPIKVYSHRGLSSEKLKSIEKHCEVIEVIPKNFSDADWNGKCLFKYVGLLNNMADYEIVLDADILFLSNIDYLFEHLENEKIIGSVENDWFFVHKVYYENDEEHKIANENIKKEFRKTVGDVIDKYSLDFVNKVYNGGFLGFNKKSHSYLLENTVKLLSDNFADKRNPIFHNEQYMINFLIELYGEDVVNLPFSEWMNTWDSHKNPKKIIKVENDKLVLYNDGNNRINLYHFTGDIGMLHTKTNNLMTCRPHQIFETCAREIYFDKKDVYDLWIKKHQSPVILLYQYFADMGL